MVISRESVTLQMKIGITLILLSSAITNAAIITQWDFSNGLTPSTGIGSISFVGGVSAELVNGPALNTSVYPPAFTGNKSAGVQFNVSTVGYRKIIVNWYRRISPTASKYGRLQYTTNGTTFVDFASPIVMLFTDDSRPITCDLTDYPGVSNNPKFAFKIVTEFESTAIGSTNEHYVTVSGTSYYTVGTVRFGNVTVDGDLMFPLLSAPTLSTNGDFKFSVLGPASNCVIQGAFDLENWIPITTNVPPFTFIDTSNAARRFYRAFLIP